MYQNLKKINGRKKEKEKFCLYKARKTNRVEKNQELEISLNKQKKYFLANAIPLIIEGKQYIVFDFWDKTNEIQHNYLQKMFIKTVGHELKHPLGLISAYAYYLYSYFQKNPDNSVKYVDKIEQQVRIINKMLDDISDAGKFSLKSFQVKRKQQDVKKLTRQIVQDIKTYYPERVINYHDLTKEKIILIPIDAVRYKQAVMNLCSNAQKYSDKDTKIDIRLKQKKQKILLSVTDYGQGIAQKNHSLLFKPFNRLGKSGRKAPGLGLGLSLVKQIMKKHDGEITVDSVKNRYSKFSLIFPNRK